MDYSIAKNIVSLFCIQGMNYLIPLITLPYLVRVLGPEGYGGFGFSLAIVQYFCLLADYGFNLSITQKVAIERNNKKEVSRIFWNVLSCKFLLALSGLMLLYMATSLIESLHQYEGFLFFSYLLVFGNVLFPIWLFQGKEKMGWIALSNIMARLSAVPLIFIFVNGNNDVWIASLITGLTAILAGLLGLFFVYQQGWVSWYAPSWYNIKNELKDGWYVFISSAAGSLYINSTPVILGFIAGPTAVGFFVAADKLRLAVQGLFSPVSQVFFPRINSIMAKDKLAAFKMIRFLLKAQGTVAALLGFCLFVFSTPLIEFIYGNKYQDSISVLHWLAWLPFIVGISNIFGVQTILVLGMKKKLSNIYVCAGVVNIFVLILLASFFQEEGAAISIFFTETLVVISMLCIIIRNKVPLFS